MAEKTVRRAGAVILSAALVFGTLGVAPAGAQAAVKAKKLKVTCAKKTLYIGGGASKKKVQLKVKVTPKKASQKVTYKSSNKKVATVSKKGKVTAKKAGKTTITVTSKSNKKLKKKIKITVKKYKAKTNTDTNTDTNGSTSATPSGNPAATSTQTPAPVSTPVPDQTPAPTPAETLAPTPDVGGDEIPATKVVLSKTKLTLTKRGNDAYPVSELTVAMTPENATSQISWSSSDEGVAKVENGVVTAVGTGTATITVASDNNKRDTCTVTVNKTTTGIHDPSIFKDPNSDNYYTIGTALGMSVSQDLQAWSPVTSGADLFKDGADALNVLFDYTKYDYTKDTSDNRIGNIWAADLIYNKAMKQYCMYVCANCGSGYGFRTAIGMYASDNVTGPYEWKGMLVCADFTKEDITSTNIMDALGLSSADEIPSYYYDEKETAGKDSQYFKNNFPDCIDPAPFYDTDGTLYMVYGSFTCYGGIRILKLDPNTGLRNKDYNYDYEEGVSDPYFGKKITDRNGEGPYILRVPSEKSSTGNYYFLWTSSGILRGTANYHMSMFRSEHADGPYEDIGGTAATAGGGSIMTYNYKYSFMNMAYTAMGGNSALRDEDGKLYLVYHNKFEDNSADPGTHMLKIHQMFLNEDGWLVATPFEYHNETAAESYTMEDVSGDYEFVKHQMGTAANVGRYNYNYSKAVKLGADGTVSGAITGTWTLQGNKITITEGNTTYKGVVCEQYEDDGNTTSVTSNDKTMVVTMLGTNKVNVWGSKVTATNKQSVTYDAGQLSVPEKAEEDFDLVTNGLYGSTITWASDKENVISISGGKASVTMQDVQETVTLKATVTKATQTVEKTFKVLVDAFEIPMPKVITSAMTLSLIQKTPAGDAITWTSSHPALIDADTGAVVMPEGDPVEVTLTASYGESSREFKIMVGKLTNLTSIFSQDYESAETTAAAGWECHGALTNVIAEADGNKYIQCTSTGSGPRSGKQTFSLSSALTDTYVVGTDFSIATGNNTGSGVPVSQIALLGADSTAAATGNALATNCIFEMQAEGSNSTEFSMNGSEKKVTIPAGTWCHMEVTIFQAAKQATVVITDKTTGDELYSNTVTFECSSEVAGIFTLNGRAGTVTRFDNTEVKDTN